jgi:alpha-mannosidase
VYAHRFVHVGEAGYGVAIANDASYGHDMSRGTRPDGGTTTTVRLSLVRGPRFPDPRADHGRHRFGYVLAPGADIADAVGEGYRANLPVRRVPGCHAVPPVVAVDDGGTGAVVVEAVKAADDRSGDLVVRLYEALGGRARATVTPCVAVTEVVETDLLERPVAAAPAIQVIEGRFSVELRPFQIRTLVLRPGHGGVSP